MNSAAAPDEHNDSVVAHPRILERRAEVENQEQRRTRRRLYVLIGFIALALLAFGIANSPLLDVNEVRVIGAERNSPDAIRTIAGVPPGTGLVGLDLEAAEFAVEALPDVVSAQVAKTWTGVVTVAIEEREAVAWIAAPAGRMIVASDGVVIDLEIAEPAPVGASILGQAGVDGIASVGGAETPEAVPELGPPDPALVEVGGAMFTSPIGTIVPIEVAGAVNVAAHVPDDIASIVERVELRIDGLRLRLAGGGLVELGDDRSLDEKFDAVRAFVAQVDLRCLEQIDVRAPTVPTLERAEACR